MAFPRLLSILANKLNNSGTLTTQGGGTGLTTPGTTGNVLTSNGTNWVSQPSGGGGGPFNKFGTTGGV